MSDRTFSLMANIDDLNAGWMLLRSADGKADFLDGLVHGSNLAPALDGMSPAYHSGYAVGSEWRAKTEAYREKQSANGKLGGRPNTKSGGLPPHNHRLSGGEAMPKLSDTGLQIKDSLPGEGCTEGTRTGIEDNPGEDYQCSPGNELLFYLPCKGGLAFPITPSVLEAWGRDFPDVDPLTEARTMHSWLEGCKSRRKTTRGMGRFFTSWLRKAQNREREKAKTGKTTSNQRDQLTDDYLAENAAFFNGATDGKTA